MFIYIFQTWINIRNHFEFPILTLTQIPISISIGLVLVVFDNLMNNLWERRQYFFLQTPFLNSSYSNRLKCIFSSQSDGSFMERYNLRTQKGGIFDMLPYPQIKIFKKGKMHTYKITYSFRKNKMFVCWMKSFFNSSYSNCTWCLFST